MNRISYEIKSDLNGVQGAYVFDTKVSNLPELQFNFNFKKYPNVDLVKMKITFDQKVRILEFDDIPNNFILKREIPLQKESNDIVLIKLFYSNFNTFEYQFPLIFTLPTILDTLEASIIQNAQLLDTLENDDIFFVMKNNKNQFFNFRSGSNIIAYKKSLAEQYIPPTYIIGAELNTNMGKVTADLITEFNEYIEVNT